MTVTPSIPALRAGDKIRFLTKAHGFFIGYVNYLTHSQIRMKGCKLVEPVQNLQDVASLTQRDMRTFSSYDLLHIEVLEPAPF